MRKERHTDTSLSFFPLMSTILHFLEPFPASHTHTCTLSSSRQVCFGAFDARMPPATLFAKPKSNKTPHEHHVLLIVFVRSWAKRWTC